MSPQEMSTEAQYFHHQIGIACSIFDHTKYETDCFKELLNTMLEDDKFKLRFSYAIYSDQFHIPNNIFVPRFHIYFLNSDTKHVILLDEGMLDLPNVYNHHKYYIYNDKELFSKFEEKYDNVQHITSITDITKELLDVSATD